jgi:1-acyl-sn-glycerol-3-phosphate acyltransferase
VLERVIAKLDPLVEKQLKPDILAWIDQLNLEQDEFGFDPFGFQPNSLKYVLPFARWLYETYFRAEVFGIENLPDKRVLVVSNHSGQIPIDGVVIASACIFARKPPRMLRAMVEKWVPTLPFISYFFARVGQVVGTRDNCKRLLAREEAILVFPEGVRGISKTFDKRYQLQPFGLGFMRLALDTGTPILPLGVVGAEEQAPALGNAERLAKLVGAPSFPLTPTFPWLGPVGLLPLPVRYRLHFGELMHFEGDPEDEDRAIEEKVDRVSHAIQTLIDQGLEQRDAIFW